MTEFEIYGLLAPVVVGLILIVGGLWLGNH